MFRNLTQRFHDLLADVHDSLTATALEPRLMPMPKTMPMTMPIPMTMPSLQGPAAQRGVRSSASTPSLRSRDGTVPNHARLDAGGNVRVVVRVRAFLPREIARSAQCLIRMDPLSQRTTLVAPGDGDADPANARARARKATVEDKSFTFDNSFWSHDTDDEHYATQEDVYDSLGEEFLDHNFEGYHTCIFAYGQTGSGKSYSMMGTADQPGLIPRTCQDLFERIAAAHDETPNISYNVRVSYFEVYNEHVRDLLAAPPAPSQAPYYLKIRESPTEGPYVKDLTDVPVRSLDEILRHMRKGDQSRTTASTKMNDTSSRSHAVFTIMLKQIHHDLDTDETTERSSRIRLVDLAGSERAKSTEATGQRLREGSNINRSLTTLGRVIAALADPKKTPSKKGPGSSSVVPYRDSILTWLLKDSLGGNSKTAMIACIAPSDYDETLSTLRYADQAKRIRTRAVVNQDSISTAERDAQIAAMADEIRALQLVVGDSRPREKDAREAEERLEDYQARVRGLQQLMDERSLVAEGKIRSLQTENEALRLHLKLALESLKNPIPVVTVREVDDGVAPNAGVEEEDGDDDVTATKKQIYRDRMLLSPKRQHHQTPDEDKENHTPKGHRHSLHHLSPDKDQDQDDGYASGGDNSDYTDTEEAPNHYEAGADDMHEQMQVLLRDLDMFRRKIGDDKSRFFLAAAADPKSLKPHHQSGNTGSGNKESLTAAAAVAISGGALARRRNPLGERSNII